MNMDAESALSAFKRGYAAFSREERKREHRYGSEIHDVEKTDRAEDLLRMKKTDKIQPFDKGYLAAWLLKRLRDSLNSSMYRNVIGRYYNVSNDLHLLESLGYGKSRIIRTMLHRHGRELPEEERSKFFAKVGLAAQ